MFQWLHGVWDTLLSLPAFSWSEPLPVTPRNAASSASNKRPAAVPPKPKRRQRKRPRPVRDSSPSLADFARVPVSPEIVQSRGDEFSFASDTELSWAEQCLLKMRNQVQSSDLLDKFTQLSRHRRGRHQQMIRRRLLAKYFPIQFDAQTILRPSVFSLYETEPFWHGFHIDLTGGEEEEEEEKNGGLLKVKTRWPAIGQIIDTKTARLRLDFATTRDEQLWCAGLMHLMFSIDSTNCIVHVFDWTLNAPIVEDDSSSSSAVLSKGNNASKDEAEKKEEEHDKSAVAEYSVSVSRELPAQHLPTSQPASRVVTPLPVDLQRLPASVAAPPLETQFKPLPLEEMAL